MQKKGETGLPGKCSIRGCNSGAGWKGKSFEEMAADQSGFCICPKCGAKAPYRDTPCNKVVCQQCGTKMVRAI